MSAAPVACFRRVHGIDFQPFVAFIQRKREFVNLHSPILSTKKENKKKEKRKKGEEMCRQGRRSSRGGRRANAKESMLLEVKEIKSVIKEVIAGRKIQHVRVQVPIDQRRVTASQSQ